MLTTTAETNQAEPSVRPLAGLIDMLGVIRIHGRSWRVAHRRLLPREVLEQTTIEADEAMCRAWLARFDRSSDRFIVAVDADDEILGFLHLRLNDDHTAHIEEQAVDPNRWREGIGTALLRRVVDDLPAHLDAIEVELLAGNGVASRFYAGHGFDRVGFRSTTIDDVVYLLAIYRGD